jgi:hypothetical protein
MVLVELSFKVHRTLVIGGISQPDVVARDLDLLESSG